MTAIETVSEPTLDEQIEAQTKFLLWLDEKKTPRASLTYVINAAILTSLRELRQMRGVLKDERDRCPRCFKKLHFDMIDARYDSCENCTRSAP